MLLSVILDQHLLNRHKLTRYHKIDHISLGYEFIVLKMLVAIKADVRGIDGTQQVLRLELLISNYLVLDELLAVQ